MPWPSLGVTRSAVRIRPARRGEVQTYLRSPDKRCQECQSGTHVAYGPPGDRITLLTPSAPSVTTRAPLRNGCRQEGGRKWPVESRWRW